MRQVKRGQVYLAVLTGKGCEQRGKRPVLIIQNNVGNHFSPTTLIAPITSSKKKRNLPVHVPVESNKLFKDSVILCEQIQVMDKSRLRKMLCKLSPEVMEQVDRAVAVSFDITEVNENE
ncbi:type II toxin-antitoxin system PemK/MazF family toxin [uncultured Ruminococcus sp.]|uniref:type II toxin-antitoxin system PemK/MazF family toxin n=1 Tax=uncultured Ruminococcus sp. TaxID=165186 RepID=UPI0025D38325|nr:type II toxin-antitoxin system PemK/MazF family toxin [uncultured Ruminococcus sp.]